MDRQRRVLGTVIAVLVIVLLVAVIVGVLWNWPENNSFSNNGNFPYWAFGLLFVIIFFGIIVRLMFWVIFGPRYRRRYWDYGWYGQQGGSAEDILDQRYAKGEITREQYIQMKDDLNREQRKRP